MARVHEPTLKHRAMTSHYFIHREDRKKKTSIRMLRNSNHMTNCNKADSNRTFGVEETSPWSTPRTRGKT